MFKFEHKLFWGYISIYVTLLGIFYSSQEEPVEDKIL